MYLPQYFPRQFAKVASRAQKWLQDAKLVSGANLTTGVRVLIRVRALNRVRKLTCMVSSGGHDLTKTLRGNSLYLT